LPSIRCFDLANGGRKIDRFPQDNQAVDISPDGRFLLTMKEEALPRQFQRILPALGPNWKMWKDEKRYGGVFDAATGTSCGVIPAKRPAFGYMNGESATRDVGWAPDGGSLAVQDQADPNLWHIWDMPPRKPLPWFALAAAVLALPLAGLAWRRSRRLRREVA
jgi:hypothetical protein